MFRLVVFRNGGTVEFDRNTGSIPNAVLNELIAREFIESSRHSYQAQIRLGKNGEFAARVSRNAETNANVALLFPAALKVVADPDEIVSDVTIIFAKYGDEDPEKFRALVDVRLQSSIIKPQKQRDESKPEVREISAEPLEDEGSISPLTKLKQPTKKKSAGAGTGTGTPAKPTKKSKSKKKRTWDGNSAGSDSDSDAVLDYSEASKSKNADDDGIPPVEQLDALELGNQTKDGFVVKELTTELSDILKDKGKSSTDSANTSTSSQPFGFLQKFVGGKKLDEKDLKSVLTAMEDHLVQKNVAKDVAAAICEGVGKDLVGTSTSSWTTVNATVRASMKRTLTKILTPSTSVDLLASIRKQKKAAGRPYVISVVGVNGVGKSTNLGKLGFWFLQNDFKVLVAACDTFRSGAVEQLAVHVKRLKQLRGRSDGDIELFDRGYGKDAAVIAKQAVEHARKAQFDVVLIDTAGRRHNDDRLMSSLEKFGDLAQPDKIIMVGEALVGTDSVEQARNFNAAFGKNRGLDFFLISKCDTVGEMLGALVNVTFATGVPVLFVGVGQQYTDLRTLSVDWAVDKLLG